MNTERNVCQTPEPVTRIQPITIHVSVVGLQPIRIVVVAYCAYLQPAKNCQPSSDWETRRSSTKAKSIPNTKQMALEFITLVAEKCFCCVTVVTPLGQHFDILHIEGSLERQAHVTTRSQAIRLDHNKYHQPFRPRCRFRATACSE